MKINKGIFLPCFIAAMLLLPSASKLMGTGLLFLLFPIAIILLSIVEKQNLFKQMYKESIIAYASFFLLSIIGLILKLIGVLKNPQYGYGEFLVVISMIMMCFALKDQVNWERWYFDIMLYAGGLILVLYFVNTAIAHDMIPLWESGTSDIYYINMVAFLVMLVAAGQFAVTSVWEKNAEICASLMAQAAENDVSLFVLPEALLARDDHDADLSVKSAQLLEGEFLGRLRRESKRNMMTTILTIHVPSTPGRAWNMLVALQAGNIVARYAKLHLYDAFAIQESRRVDAGNEIAPLLEVEGMKVGLMICYDLRFPELALAQALQGAEILVLPAAWVRGPLKEHHWSTLLAARALDTTCYMVAAGECGNKNIGQSRIIDPFGVTIAAASEMPALIMAEVTPERVRQVRAQLPVLNNRRFAPPQLL